MPENVGLRGLVVAVGLTGAAPLVAETHLDRAFFIQVAASVLKVEARNSSGGYALGTAVAVAPGIAVTNCHVTRDAQTISLVKGAARWPVASQFADVRHDLCLLAAPMLEATPVRVGSAKALRVGQRVGALGYTGGVEMAFREGVVGALHRFDGSNVIQSTTAFTSGASGGGLFDEEGHLVGILTFRLPGPQAYYFSAPVDWIVAQLGGSDGYIKVVPHPGGMAFWQQPAARLPYFMRAARLEAEGKWQELLQLAEEWSDSDRESSEPWLSRGKAYVRLDRREGAARAFEKAVALDPDSGEALFHLGLTYFSLGETEALQRVFARLRDVNADLADDLAVVGGLCCQSTVRRQ